MLFSVSKIIHTWRWIFFKRGWRTKQFFYCLRYKHMKHSLVACKQLRISLCIFLGPWQKRVQIYSHLAFSWWDPKISVAFVIHSAAKFMQFLWRFDAFQVQQIKSWWFTNQLYWQFLSKTIVDTLSIAFWGYSRANF